MPEDFRVKVGFFGHPKTVKLRRLCGPAGPLAFLQLIGFCAGEPSRNTGDLSGMDVDDIEIAAGWEGERGALVRALRKVGYLEGENQIHDFGDHQPWVANAPDRSTSGRVAGLKRWHRAGKHAAPRKGCPLCEEENLGNLRNSVGDLGNSVGDLVGRTRYLEKNGSKGTKSGSKAKNIDAPSPTPSPSPSPTPSPAHTPTDGALRKMKPIFLNGQRDDPEWVPGTPIQTVGQFLDATKDLCSGTNGWSPTAKLRATIRAGPIEPWEYESVIREAVKDRKGPGWVAGKIFGVRKDTAELDAAPPVPKHSELQPETLEAIRRAEAEAEAKEQTDDRV